MAENGSILLAIDIDRLWLAGFGFIALASNGAALIRTVIDGAVFSPERLDFVGRPIISGAGLEYTPPEATYTEGGMLDTASLPDLTEDEQAQVKRLIADAKETAKPMAATKETEWTTAKIETMTAAGVPVEKARDVISQILIGGYQDLYDGFIIEFTTGAVSVSDVLKNPKAWDNKACADPVEGIGYGATTAKFYWNKGAKPFINSQAHGGGKYFLHQSESVSGTAGKDFCGMGMADVKRSGLDESNIEHIEPCTPKANENPVISTLREQGFYSKPLGGNKHEIVCPFSQDTNTRAAYYEPSGKHPRGGYRCQCALCARKHRIGDLLQLLGISKAESLNKPNFKVIGGELATIVDTAEHELGKTVNFFQQGGGNRQDTDG